MSEHYYSNTPSSKTQEQKHQVFVLNGALNLWTDHGVFSKTELDFGSRVLIETIVTYFKQIDSILDVGCGYGPIGISLGKNYSNAHLEMIDINERAVHLSKKNCIENQLNDALVYQSNIYEKVSKNDFELIVSNPPIRAGKNVVHEIIEKSIEHLQYHGTLVIVIQKKQGAPSAQKKMEEVFGNSTILTKEKGYWIISSKKEEKGNE